MNPKLPLLLFSLLPLGMATALPSRGQELLNEAPVLWEPVIRSTAPKPRQPGITATDPAEEIVWELVPESKAANGQPSKPTNDQAEVVWSLVPETPQLAETTPPTNGGASASTQQVVWEEIPGSVNPLGPTPSSDVARKESAGSDEPPADAVAFENSQPARRIPAPPSPPALQALNRSIAFGDGMVGPDIGYRIPQGFIWNANKSFDFQAGIYSYQNGREISDPLIPRLRSGNLDGTAIVHANLYRNQHWSVAINTSFRSVLQDTDIGGGSTPITDGLSSGFRISRSLGDTAGISFGGEQVIQWDDQVDSGRNFYLMASKGWWLGRQGSDFPLLVANGGIGSGKLASFTNKGEALRFTCIQVERNRAVATGDEDLCWGPAGSVGLVMNEWWGVFMEYARKRGNVGLSLNLSSELPIRLTASVNVLEHNVFVDPNRYRWMAGASIGF